jgi:hypothetical protein
MWSSNTYIVIKPHPEEAVGITEEEESKSDKNEKQGEESPYNKRLYQSNEKAQAARSQTITEYEGNNEVFIIVRVDTRKEIQKNVRVVNWIPEQDNHFGIVSAIFDGNVLAVATKKKVYFGYIDFEAESSHSNLITLGEKDQKDYDPNLKTDDNPDENPDDKADEKLRVVVMNSNPR